MGYEQARDRGVITLGILITLISLGGAFALGDYTIPPPEEEPDGDTWAEVTTNIEFTGTANEGSTAEETVTMDEKKVVSMTFTLTWTDEPDADPFHTNAPDTLSLGVESEFGSDEKQDSGGRVEITFAAPSDKPWNMEGKTWNVTITAVDCGDQQPLIPDPLGLRTWADGGNAYKLDVQMVSLSKVKPA